ncbi:uncharacterized protein CXorf58 homolog [Corticium candelabrum]|uniref:uncharacterized protein CXorf58 homolog n=1 Tax=Corticium candelabrum TaxID=121492 RepID=UPI002E258E89|nr:uncharacterized protein CXorf58 homolog [Corticium candelabrum]
MESSPQNIFETDSVMKARAVIKEEASKKIQRCWCSYRDRQLFKMLKSAVCVAEQSLSCEVLKRVCPAEFDLLKDPAMNTKIKFRFGGQNFPPIVLFKIFVGGDGTGIHYMTGKRLIEPASEAAEDARRMMGNRKFFDQMLLDTIQQQRPGGGDEAEITTVKDYMQVLSHVDESPASLGGKANMWRKLTLDSLPRQTIMYDVVEYLSSRVQSSRLQKEMHSLISSRSPSRKQQTNQIRAHSNSGITSAKVSRNLGGLHNSSGRGSRQARHRVLQMRKLYEEFAREDTCSPAVVPFAIDQVEQLSEKDLEEQADQLYEWTQDLNIDSVD